MVTITESNIDSIYGMLKKFFISDTHGYITWHNFDCGKRKIRPYLGVEREYWDKPISFEMVPARLGLWGRYLRLNIGHSSAVLFNIGDRIEIKSGKITLVQEWIFSDNFHFISQVFQAQKPTEAYLRQLSDRNTYSMDFGDWDEREED